MSPNQQDPIMVSPASAPSTPVGPNPPSPSLNPSPSPGIPDVPQPVTPTTGFIQPTTVSPNMPSTYPANQPDQTAVPAPVPAPSPIQPGSSEVGGPYSQAAPVQPLSSPQPMASPFPVNPTNPYVSAPAPTPAPAPMGPMSGISPSGPGGVVAGDFSPPPAPGMPAPYVPQPPAKKSRKKLFLASGMAALLALVGVGYLTFFYLPNTPANVWKTGLDRSGRALSTVSTKATEKEALESFSKSRVTATISGSGEGMNLSGSLDTKFDSLTSDSDLKFNSKSGTSNVALGLKLLTDLQKGKQYPDVHFQFVGLKAMGYDEIFPDIAKYEGKWITVDSNYIAKNTILKENQQAQVEQLTAAEVAEMANVITKISDEYLFTSDESKAVLVQKQFIAKETTDGKDTYHYKVGMNANNAKLYCKAMVEGVMSLPSAKRLAGDGSEQLKKDGIKSCDEIKEIKEEFDLWIDAKYKLIYKIRISDENNKEAYVDIGQDYKGTDDVTGFINYVDGKAKSEVDFSVTTNLALKTTKAKLDIKNTGLSPFNATIDVKIEPYDGEIDVKKPAGSIPIEDVMKAFEKSFNSPTI